MNTTHTVTSAFLPYDIHKRRHWPSTRKLPYLERSRNS